MPIEIIQDRPLPASCEIALAERYKVHNITGMLDRQQWLEANGARIRALVTAKAPEALISQLPGLEIIVTFGVGYDGVDTAAARMRGIRVANTPNVLNDAVAELAIGLMVSLTRSIPQADRFVRGGGWASASFPPTTELMGKTVGIIGLGRIGKEIATRAQAMKMRVVYHGRHRQLAEPYVYYDDVVDMARDSDWLVVIAPGGRGTERIVSRRVLEALGPRGRLVNLARGSLVDEPALLDLLQSGGLAGAALDVFEGEPAINPAFFALDNVVLSPHQASATVETRDAMGALLVANLDAHFAGEPLISAVV